MTAPAGSVASSAVRLPLMLVVIVLAARWTARKLALPPAPATRLGAGIVGLGLVLASELMLVRWLRGVTIEQYVASRDPVAGTAYIVLLETFAVMPLFVARE